MLGKHSYEIGKITKQNKSHHTTLNKLNNNIETIIHSTKLG